MRAEARQFRRLFRYSRPYRLMLIGFLVTIVADSLVALAPPLLFRRLIDHTIPAKDLNGVTVIGLAVVGLAVADSALSIGQRWSNT